MAYNQDQSTEVLGPVPVQTSAAHVTYSEPITGGVGPFQVERFKGQQSVCVGAVLMIVGLLAVAFNIADLVISTDLRGSKDGYRYLSTECSSGGCIAHGFWGGILTIITGALGMTTGKNRTRCLITALLIHAIITMVATGIQTIIAAAFARDVYMQADYISCLDTQGKQQCQQLFALVAMEALMAATGGIAFFLCLWASVLCCSGTSCCHGPTAGATYAVTTGGPQMTVLTQQQCGQQYVQPPMQQQQQLQQQQQQQQLQQQPQPQQYQLVYNPATGCYSYASAPVQLQQQCYMFGSIPYNIAATPSAPFYTAPCHQTETPGTSPCVTQPDRVAPPADAEKCQTHNVQLVRRHSM